MKLLKSECGKAWLFDVVKEDYFLVAGFSCFLPGCDPIIAFAIGGKIVSAITPNRATTSIVPVRILNARLALR